MAFSTWQACFDVRGSFQQSNHAHEHFIILLLPTQHEHHYYHYSFFSSSSPVRNEQHVAVFEVVPAGAEQVAQARVFALPYMCVVRQMARPTGWGWSDERERDSWVCGRRTKHMMG